MADILFTTVPRILKDLISEIENGKLALPELQRGYVWEATKVRDLLDSMMNGYPVGYLMIWEIIMPKLIQFNDCEKAAA